MDGIELFLALTYTAYIASPIVRDELLFRLALLATSIGFVAWGVMVDERVVVAANALFVLLSLRHVVRLARQRRPVVLDEEENHVYNALFAAMTPREFLTLWRLGEPATVPAGALITVGQVVDDVLVVLDRHAAIELADDERIAAAPSLLGEMSYALGEAATATATVRVDAPARVRRWTKATLRDLERSHPDLAVPFLAAVGQNLARKIRV